MRLARAARGRRETSKVRDRLAELRDDTLDELKEKLKAGDLSAITIIPLTKLEGKGGPARRLEVELTAGLISPGITSLAQPNQIRTISKSRLIFPSICRISDPVQQRAIEDMLLDHLDIEFDEDADTGA